MRPWKLSNRIKRSHSAHQAMYLAERSISRYNETRMDWAAQFEPTRIDAAREKLNRRSLLKIAAARYFKPLRVFAF